MFIVRIFANYTITIAVWTSFQCVPPLGRQMVLGYFLGLELQKLLIGRLSGTFIYEFLKSLKVLSVYESIKILLERGPLHVVLPGRFGGWAHLRVKSSQPASR